MKTFLISLLALTACLHASAQVSVDLGLDQEQFLPNEAVRLAVKITNRSGQPVHLGADASWLTFSVESQEVLWSSETARCRWWMNSTWNRRRWPRSAWICSRIL